jgi:hypothetical protein
MSSVFASPWLGRGVRLAVLVDLLAAGWHAWTVFVRYQKDQISWIKSKLTYECAARTSPASLAPARQ